MQSCNESVSAISALYNSDEQQNEDSHCFLLKVYKLLNTSLLLFSECI